VPIGGDGGGGAGGRVVGVRLGRRGLRRAGRRWPLEGAGALWEDLRPSGAGSGGVWWGAWRVGGSPVVCGAAWAG